MSDDAKKAWDFKFFTAVPARDRDDMLEIQEQTKKSSHGCIVQLLEGYDCCMYFPFMLGGYCIHKFKSDDGTRYIWAHKADPQGNFARPSDGVLRRAVHLARNEKRHTVVTVKDDVAEFHAREEDFEMHVCPAHARPKSPFTPSGSPRG